MSQYVYILTTHQRWADAQRSGCLNPDLFNIDEHTLAGGDDNHGAKRTGLGATNSPTMLDCLVLTEVFRILHPSVENANQAVLLEIHPSGLYGRYRSGKRKSPGIISCGHRSRRFHSLQPVDVVDRVFELQRRASSTVAECGGSFPMPPELAPIYRGQIARDLASDLSIGTVPSAAKTEEVVRKLCSMETTGETATPLVDILEALNDLLERISMEHVYLHVPSSVGVVLDDWITMHINDATDSELRRLMAELVNYPFSMPKAAALFPQIDDD